MAPRHFRVAMVAACPFPARRGTPLRIERLTEALCRRGHDVEVITYHIGEESETPGFRINRIYDRLEQGQLPPGPTIAKLVRYDPALAKLLRRVLRARPFDVIHAHHFEGLLAARWGRRGLNLPLVYDAHTMLQSELPSYGTGPGKRLTGSFGRWLDGILPPLANHVVTVTDDIRDRLVQDHQLDPETVTTGMNGVELEVFEQAALTRPLTQDRIIYTGTLANYQNFDLLLDAFAEAYKQRSSLHLVCAASSSFEPYEERARRLGIRQAITLEAESFDKLPERLAGASMAVMPRTRCDGIPQKLLNYMAAGMPIVCSEGSAKVIDHEVNGLVVPNDDVLAFADAILRVSRDAELAAKLGKAARAYVVQNCSWERTAEICESVYEALIPPHVRTKETRSAGEPASVMPFPAGDKMSERGQFGR